MRAFWHEAAVIVGTLLFGARALVLTDEAQSATALLSAAGWRRDGEHALERRQANETIAAPLVASVSQFWEGNDGPWSSFAIQIGNKPQNVRVLPSTASTSTWVVYEEGCPTDAPSDCADNRGGTFNPNSSLTRVPNSIFQLGVEENLGFSVFGDFGFDTVTLGWQGSGGPSVEHSIVAGIADTTFSWLGVLGLNPRPTNFSSFPNSPQVSLLQSLRNQNNIPSLSWAYTAGAQYQLNKVFGSLILGGYDSSRLSKPPKTSPDLTFPFYTDIARDLLVGITSITTDKSTSSSAKTLLKDGIFAMLDSTIPYFYLPQAVCEAFESAFGLKWNTTSELYTLSGAQHAALVKLNPSITFTLAPEVPAKAANQSVDITLPYSAFDLNVSWPYAESSTAYFPLKRATNETQYTLGRAFFQEAYVIADYERQNFSVWPCKWDSDTNNAKVLPILSRDASTNSTGGTGDSGSESSNSSKKGLATGAIAGIAIGAVLGIVGLAAAIWFFCFKKSQPEKRTSNELEAHERPGELSPDGIPAYHIHKKGNVEADSSPLHEMPDPEFKFGELGVPGAHGKFEMDGTATPTELDAARKGPYVGNVYEMDAGPGGGKLDPWLRTERGTSGGGEQNYFPDNRERQK